MTRSTVRVSKGLIKAALAVTLLAASGAAAGDGPSRRPVVIRGILYAESIERIVTNIMSQYLFEPCCFLCHPCHSFHPLLKWQLLLLYSPMTFIFPILRRYTQQ